MYLIAPTAIVRSEEIDSWLFTTPWTTTYTCREVYRESI
jgi:hypothetical protein